MNHSKIEKINGKYLNLKIKNQNSRIYFEENGIEVTYEAQMPQEHQQERFDLILEEIKVKARSKYTSYFYFS